MSIYTKNLKQTAVYWANTGQPGADGRIQLSSPTEVGCRWVNSSKMVLDAQGAQKMSLATIYVAEDLEVGGWLWLGDIDDSSLDENTPQNNSGAVQIISFDKIPRANGRDFLRVAYV